MPGYSLMGDGGGSSGPTVNISEVLDSKPGQSTGPVSPTKGGPKDDNLTPAQRMAMARRRYSIILPAVAARRSMVPSPTKPKKEVSHFMTVTKTSSSGFDLVIKMEDYNIRKEK